MRKGPQVLRHSADLQAQGDAAREVPRALVCNCRRSDKSACQDARSFGRGDPNLNRAELVAKVKSLPVEKQAKALELWHAIARQRADSISSSGNYLTFREFIAKVNPKFKFYRHCEILIDVFERVVSGEIKRLMVFAPPRHGKALAVDTPIPTPEGWKAIGDLTAGDEVFAGDGSVTKVSAANRWINRPVYKVTTDDGQSLIADEAHEWVVRLCRKHKAWKVYETGFLANRASTRNPLIPQHGALNLPDANLPIPPYTLGAWLGDGSSHYAAITSGDQDRDFIRAQIEADGFVTREHSSRYSFGILGLNKLLRGAELLKNKHVPDVYKRASVDQRTSLIQGMMDTDGAVNKDGQCFYYSTKRRLVDDFMELAHGLGLKASMSEGRAKLNGKDCGPKYSVTFYWSKAARLPRKATRAKDGTRTPGRFLTFERYGFADTACIEVEHPSHMFLAGKGCIVSHNSELISRLLAPYFLYRHPEKWAAISSYGAELAYDLSRAARRNYLTAIGGETDSDTLAVKHWETGKGGGLWALGVGGPATGKGYHLGIVDDPVKDRREAESELIRSRVKDWYQSVWLTRAEPDASMIVMQTRWQESDLSGFLLEEELGEEPENWHVVSLPAIAEDEPPDIPPSCTLEPDFRKPGEALCPERYPLERLRKIEQRVGPYVWNSLFQQRPRPIEGGMFKWSYFEGKYLDAMPADIVAWIAYWDTAGTEGAGDNTAGALVGKRKDGSFHIAEVVAGQWGVERKDSEIAATCHRWQEIAPSMRVWLEHEAGIGGKDRTKATIRALAGFAVKSEHVTGNKLLRAEPWAAQAQAGNVTLSRGPWNHPFLTECAAFPHGKNDDRVDAVSGAFAKLSEFAGIGFAFT